MNQVVFIFLLTFGFWIIVYFSKTIKEKKHVDKNNK